MRLRPLLVALVAALAPVAAAPAAAAPPTAVDTTMAVGGAGTTARAASATWTSRVLRPARRFDVFGLRWSGAAGHVHIEARVKPPGRPWRRWVEVPHEPEHGGDRREDGRRASDPVWAGGAERLQLRIEGRRPRGLRVHLVSVRGARGRPAPRARAAQAQQPAITPRSQWDPAGSCRPRGTPSIGRVDAAFVHHTVTANDYGPQDSAAMVLGICRFHRNGNGWDDVGYNFLVDKYGQVFEGRAGGIDQAVVGAQAQGYNAQSTGIANLGTYQDVPQTDAAIDAMARLIAWKLPLHGAPVTGRVTLTSAGGSSNRHPQGAAVAFERISGHRDGNRTDCPGAQLYAQLPRLRSLAAQRAPSAIPPGGFGAGGAPARVTLVAAPGTLAFPEPAQLSGTLTDEAGAGIANGRVRIQLLTAKGFRAVATATTGPDGGWTHALPTARNRTVRAIAGPATSAPARVTVAPALALTPATAPRVLAGRRAVVRGTIRPRKAALRVVVTRQAAPGRWERPVTYRVRAADGRFRAAVALRRPGLHRVRVRFPGDRLNAPAQVEATVRAVRTRAGLRTGVSGGSGGQAAR